MNDIINKINEDVSNNKNIILRLNKNIVDKKKLLNSNNFKVKKFNNLILKNCYFYMGYTDDNFIDSNYNITEDYFDFYRKVLSSNIACIVFGGFNLDIIDDNDGLKLKIPEESLENIKNFNNEIHTFGCKSFLTIKSNYGRADISKKFFNFLSYSASFNKEYSNSKFPCMRISDGICNEIINKLVYLSSFYKNLNYDGIHIDGDLFSIIGELSSPELNRRLFGYYSDISDFSIKLINKIIENDSKTNIIYSFSISTFVREIFGENYKNINSIKNFNENFDLIKIINFMLKLIKSGVDGFNFKFGTYETEFLTSPTEFVSSEIFQNIYLKIDNYFKSNKIKNKFSNDVILIYNDLFYEEDKNITNKDNIFMNITNKILADFDYINKSNSNIDYKKCIRCGECSNKFNSKNATSCVINPRIDISSCNGQDKNVAVIGGGISGINCAILLAKMGYSVELFEKNNVLNKNNRLREIYGYNSLVKEYNDYLENQLNYFIKCNKIKVNLGKNFNLNILKNKQYYSIVLATGTRESYLNIPGAVLKNVKNLYDVLDNYDSLKDTKNIIINAKSELSFALAQYLLLHGKKVTIIIESIDFLLNMLNSRLTYYLYSLKELKCNMFLFAKIKRIENDFVEVLTNSKLDKMNFIEVVLNSKSGVKYKLEKKAKILDMDIFINEPTLKSNNKLYYEIVNSNFDGKVFMIGNALYPCDLSESIKTAFFVSKNI